MLVREEPRHHCAPVVARDVSARTSEGPDDSGDVLDQVVDAVIVNLGRCIAQAVAPHVGCNSQSAGARDRIDLLRPGLGAFWKTVEEDDHLSARRTVGQHPEAQAVGLDHVLAGRHFTFFWMKSAAASSAWSSTASRPCP